LLEVKPGFNADRMVTMWLNFTSERYAAKGAATLLLDQLLPRLVALPGVEGVAVSNDLPLEGAAATPGSVLWRSPNSFARSHTSAVVLHTISSILVRHSPTPFAR